MFIFTAIGTYEPIIVWKKNKYDEEQTSQNK